MKKTFQLAHEKIKYPRMIESVKAEVRKHLKRCRRKPLPKDADFWDFDCKFGDTEKHAKSCHLAEIDKNINHAEEQELKSFYIEVIAIHGKRKKHASGKGNISIKPKLINK
jgi:hypothetical protein